MTYEEFKCSVQKLYNERKHKITGSVGVYQAYKWIRKNKWLNIGKPLTEHEFYTIIRKINNYLANELINGNDIIFPHNMGKLEIRKRKSNIRLNNGVIKTDLPIDWDRTLRLWYEDKESFKNKTLIKAEEKEIYHIHYNRLRCNFNNKSFYAFEVNRDIKKRLKQKIREGKFDAFIF